jgi:O-antigen/teichoic acid export membrane protein
MAAALISLNVNVIRFFIGTVRSSTELGIYAVLSYPLVAGNLVIAAVSTASLARLAKHAAHNEYDAFGHMLVKLVGIAIAFAIAAVGLGWVLGAFLLELLVGAEYAAHNSVFRVLLLGMGIGFVNWFLNSALTASKQFRLALALQVASLLLTVGLGWWFIDRWSIEGAAWATVIVLGANVIAKGVLLARFVAAGTRRATAFATPVRAGERRLA